jgi:hypothetical protein
MPGRQKNRQIISQRRQEFSHLSTAFRPVLCPNRPLIYRVPGSLSMEVKWPGRENNHSSPSSAEVHSTIYLQGVVLN